MPWRVNITPRYERRRHNIKWTRQMEEKLLQLIKKQEDLGKTIDWRSMAQELGKESWSCYNKYIQLKDPDWTPEEEERLGRFYERVRSRAGFKLTDYVTHFPRHKLKMILFKLEQLTRWNRFRPKFTIPQDILREVENVK